MPLDINHLKAKPGTMKCNLWENENAHPPLSLFYSMEIPLEPFDNGHDWDEQPCETALRMDNLIFDDDQGEQIKNWTDLIGKEFDLSFDNETEDSSIYLGTEHCQFDSYIHFTHLEGTMLDIELALDINFNTATINLPEDGLVRFQTKVNFEGLLRYPSQKFPPPDALKRLVHFDVFQDQFQEYQTRFRTMSILPPRVQ